MLPGVERALMRLAEVAPQFVHELKRLNDNLEKLERRRRPEESPRETNCIYCGGPYVGGDCASPECRAKRGAEHIVVKPVLSDTSSR